MLSSWQKLVLFLGGGIIFLLLLLIILIPLWLRLPGWVDFAWHWRTYQAVAEAAKRWPLQPGQRVELSTSSDLAVTSMRIAHEERAMTSTASRVGKISVERNAGGSYRVTFVSIDHHHAGWGGYVFQDENFGAAPSDAPWEPGNTVKRISNNWYAFFNNDD